MLEFSAQNRPNPTHTLIAILIADRIPSPMHPYLSIQQDICPQQATIMKISVIATLALAGLVAAAAAAETAMLRGTEVRIWFRCRRAWSLKVS